MPAGKVAVAHIASGDLWAGAEAQLCELVQALQGKTDLTIHVVLLNEGELGRRLRAAGVAVTVFDERRLGPLQLLRELRRFVRDTRPCVIHTHRFKENILGALAARAVRGVKSVRTTHGAAEHAGRSWKEKLIRHLDIWTGRHLQQRIVAVSSDLAASLAEQFGASHVICIPNGINVEAVRSLAKQPVSVDLGAAAPRVGFIGRLVGVKRVDIVLQLARLAAEEHPGRYTFFIVGDGPLAASLQQETKALGLDSSVRFLGFQNNCLPLLKQMDVLLITSDHEGLPMVGLESLALGVPMVSHAVGGLKELLADRDNGELVASQQPQALLDAIERLLARRAAGCGSVRLPELFTIENCARGYHNLYLELA